MAIAASTVISAISLIWDIYKRITDDVVKVEKNPELKGGEAKRIYVEQEAVRAIDGLDLPDEIKAEAKRNIRPAIEHDVKRFNDNGLFAHEDKKE
jgi:hypothetical protein